MIRRLARKVAQIIARELDDPRDDGRHISDHMRLPVEEPLPPWVRPFAQPDIVDDQVVAAPGEAVPLTPDQRAGLEAMRDRYAPDRQRKRVAEQLANRQRIHIDELRRRTERGD